VQRISEESGIEPNPWRFRPNLLVNLDSGVAFEELKWVGCIMRLGDKARIAVTEVDERCVMITLDPSTTESAPQVLKCVVQQHTKCAGVYATVLAPGEVHTGDAIILEE
jgi:hypothetical protein